MLPHLTSGVPVVALYNNVETFLRFLNRTEDRRVLESRQFRGDRALFWLGDPKLVIATAPIPHTDYVQQFYPGTHCLAPAEPTAWLSLDVERDARLRQAIVAWAGPARTVQLIPYASTHEFLHLAEVLRHEEHLTVLTPETPTPAALWLRDYIDTKSGFRALAAHWLPNAAQVLLPGVICRDAATAADAAHWFYQRGETCIVKADSGESGLGHIILRADEALSFEAIQRRLQRNSFLHDDLIVVEQYVEAATPLSPSLEFFVPPPEVGEPRLTYLSHQLFRGFGQFSGVVVDRAQLEAPWYPVLAESGWRLARQLQSLGYVGHFDLDAAVDDAERVWLLEINARRTGGTYVHEFAAYTFGPHYLDEVTLVSHAKLPSGHLDTLPQLLAALADLLYPMGTRRRGVVITVTSALAAHEFGCILVADSLAEALAWETDIINRTR